MVDRDSRNRQNRPFGNAYGGKITKDDVIQIRELFINGMDAQTIAISYNLTPVSIRNIVSRRTWKNI